MKQSKDGQRSLQLYQGYFIIRVSAATALHEVRWLDF
jgi:hypothetical protein